MEARRLEPIGQGLDELIGNLQLGLTDFDAPGLEAFHSAHLVLVVHRVQHQAASVGTQTDGIFAVVHGQLGDGVVAIVGHGAR